MAKISWNQTGERFFETGLDRGVLYPVKDGGVPWNGLIAVTESPSGGESTPYFMDGVKYESATTHEDFNGTIEAYTYPDEFEQFDGYEEVFAGISAAQQYRQSFGLCYRTKIGNDVSAVEHGYKIHLVYNAQVAPSERANGSLDDEPDAINFSWPFTTRPEKFHPSLKRTAHIIIHSNKINPLILETIEESLYGTATKSPTLLSPVDLMLLYENILPGYFGIDADVAMGLSELVEGGGGDVQLGSIEGLYLTTPVTRLVEGDPGLYTLEG